MLVPLKWNYTERGEPFWGTRDQPYELGKDIRGWIYYRIYINPDEQSDPFLICKEVDGYPGVYDTSHADMFHAKLYFEFCNAMTVHDWYDHFASEEEVGEYLENKWYQDPTHYAGLADNLDQIMAHFKSEIDDLDTTYVLEVQEWYIEGYPNMRWHKWGDYIGTQKVTGYRWCDDPHIKRLWHFQLHEIFVEDVNGG